ncbi:MAG: hypothetical protein KJN81_01770, partial [Acidimicrobiia bacterium]|nr:hypothetical protein [Acidimicrobiia bacterium]
MQPDVGDAVCIEIPGEGTIAGIPEEDLEIRPNPAALTAEPIGNEHLTCTCSLHRDLVASVTIEFPDMGPVTLFSHVEADVSRADGVL